ncbi:MAG: hypothetical protein QOH38_792 [Thermoleophilaceae bacterium]|nr:hypothetical protein [Thermoleophilaceae bacterium]
MPRTARGLVAVAAVVVVILSLVAGQAAGGTAVDGVTPSLQPVGALDGVTSHVPTPSVPSVPHVPTPSVPSTPSVPQAPSVPSLPSSSSPSVSRTAPGAVTSRAPGGSSSAGGSSASSARGSSAAGASSRSSSTGTRTRAASAGERRRARAAHESRLRRDVERYSGCLDALPGAEGRLLALRGGAGSASPLSRSAAAEQLGISTHRAALIEHRGLHRLRDAGRSGACGAGAAAARRRAVLGTGGASVPPLEPAMLLVHHPALTSPEKLALRGKAGDSTEAAGSDASGSGPAEGVVHALKTSSKTAGYLAALGLLALLTLALIFAWRRRGQGGAPRLAEQTGSAAVWWPAAADELPPVAPDRPVVQENVASPFADAPQPGAHSGDEGVVPAAAPAPAKHRPQRGPAAVAAASLVSLGVALLGRRRRRR